MSSKFTKGRQRAIIKSLKGGNYAKVAAETNGIAEKTYYEWIKRGEAALAADEGERDSRENEYAQFVEKVRTAEALAEADAVQKLIEADDWRAQMEYLARRYPERWAKRENVDVTTKGQPIRTVEVVRTVREGED